MASFADFKCATLRLATNLRGWKTRRKLLVIESDDWGAIRMPGPEAWTRLLKAGIRVDRSRYDSLDCLENRDDFQALMNVIEAHRDANGRPAIFTFNTVMGNPDFEAIERGSFEHFHHQHLFESYRHYHGQDLEADWRKAMDARLIRPQFHSREHLNSPLWMSDLQTGHEETRLAFRHGFYGLKTRTGSPRQENYLAAYWPDSSEHLADITEILDDGLSQFRHTFGFDSATFVGCNYVWPEAIEVQLAERGVMLFQTQRGHRQPDPYSGGSIRVRRHYTGQTNRYGQRYAVRNVLFEPYLEEENDSTNRALAEICQSFRLNRPAVVCSHRINYVGGMNRKHRDRSLTELDRLLTGVRHRWPDVEFVTSEMLLGLMEAEE